MLIAAAAGALEKCRPTAVKLTDGQLLHPDGPPETDFWRGRGRTQPNCLVSEESGPRARRRRLPAAPSAAGTFRGKVDGSAEFGNRRESAADAVRGGALAPPRFGAPSSKSSIGNPSAAKPGVADVVPAAQRPCGRGEDLLAGPGAPLDGRRVDVEAATGSALTSSGGLPPVYSERLSAGPFFTHLAKDDGARNGRHPVWNRDLSDSVPGARPPWSR